MDVYILFKIAHLLFVHPEVPTDQMLPALEALALRLLPPTATPKAAAASRHGKSLRTNS